MLIALGSQNFYFNKSRGEQDIKYYNIRRRAYIMNTENESDGKYIHV